MLLNSYIAWNMATTVRNSKKKTISKHPFCAILGEEMITFTSSDVEQTLSNKLLGNNIYNTLYNVDDVCCTNHLIYDHFPVTNEHWGTSHPRCDVCQIKLNIWKKSGILRNFL